MQTLPARWERDRAAFYRDPVLLADTCMCNVELPEADIEMRE